MFYLESILEELSPPSIQSDIDELTIFTLPEEALTSILYTFPLSKLIGTVLVLYVVELSEVSVITYLIPKFEIF